MSIIFKDQCLYIQARVIPNSNSNKIVLLQQQINMENENSSSFSLAKTIIENSAHTTLLNKCSNAHLTKKTGYLQDIIQDITVRIYTTSSPENGKANNVIIGLIARKCSIAKCRIKILRGAKTRNKLIQILEIDDEKIGIAIIKSLFSL